MHNKIEIGEYVKTKDGIIAQIKSIDYRFDIYRFDRIIYINDFGMRNDVLYNNEMFKKVIVKHSKQLIDLIECGDYVNGMEVLDIHIPRDIWEPIEIRVDSRCMNFILAEDIKTIQTRESYMANCYKVGGKNE